MIAYKRHLSIINNFTVDNLLHTRCTAVKMRSSHIYKYIKSRVEPEPEVLSNTRYTWIDSNQLKAAVEDDLRIDPNRSNARQDSFCTHTWHKIIAKVHVKFYWMNIFARFSLRSRVVMHFAAVCKKVCKKFAKVPSPRIRTLCLWKCLW